MRLGRARLAGGSASVRGMLVVSEALAVEEAARMVSGGREVVVVDAGVGVGDVGDGDGDGVVIGKYQAGAVAEEKWITGCRELI